MEHCFVDLEAQPLPSWREAFHDARWLARERLAELPAEGAGIVWCRVRAGEAPEEVLRDYSPRPGRHLVVLADEPDEAMVTRALAAGAAGCCNTHAAPEVIRQVALVVENGGLWVGQSLLSRLIGNTARILSRRESPEATDDWSGLLSEREVQVARLVASGESNKEIARELAITERTVKAHLTAIFEKLGLRDRLHLSLRVNGLPL